MFGCRGLAPASSSARLQQRPHCRLGSRSDRAVQRRHARTVPCVGIRADRHEVTNDVGLGDRIPMIRIRGIVKRFRPPAIPGADIGPPGQEKFRQRSPEGRCRHVQCGVAGVQVMRD